MLGLGSIEEGLHNFWLNWLTHISKELRGLIDSGVCITKYYFPRHLRSHSTSILQPKEERFGGFKRNFGQ